MKKETREAIKNLIKNVVRNKIENFESETEYKPFFDAIFDKKQVITHSLVHSFYTTFGMSIYEQISILLARDQGYYAERQYILKGEIDKKTEQLIAEIHMSLRKVPQ